MSNNLNVLMTVNLLSQISLKFWPMMVTDEERKSWKFHGHSFYDSGIIGPFFVFQAKIRHFEFTFYIINLDKMVLWSWIIWNLEAFWCEKSKNTIQNYPSESVPKLLAIFALPLLLRCRTKKSMAEKFFLKKLVHPNFFNVELSYMQKWLNVLF